MEYENKFTAVQNAPYYLSQEELDDPKIVIQKFFDNRHLADPNIMMGKPVIKGTRITVQIILEKLVAGESVDNILEAYPHLREEQIREAIAFAAA